MHDFECLVRRHTMLNEDYKKYYDVWPHTAHPMAIIASAISGMSTFYQESLDPHNPKSVEISTIRLLAKTPTIAAYAYKKSIGQPFVYPQNHLNYSSNFLHMMFSVPTERYQFDPLLEKALNKLLIVHADHEQNCSTSTVRLVGSSYANIYASISAGILALWGPLHGGANQAVIEMLMNIHQSKEPVTKYIERAKNPNDSFRLMGFGHRVYKNFDPRSKFIKDMCHEILALKNTKDPLLDIALEIEEMALNDDYFIQRKLYPNVDYYSGIIYRAMGIPINMFTVMFVLGRMPGWIAHWVEMIQDPSTRIGRPRQVYTGETKRDYIPLDQRN